MTEKTYTHFSEAWYAKANQPLASGADDDIHIDGPAGGYLVVEFMTLGGKPTVKFVTFCDGVSLLVNDPDLIPALANLKPYPGAFITALNGLGYKDVTPREPRS